MSPSSRLSLHLLAMLLPLAMASCEKADPGDGSSDTVIGIPAAAETVPTGAEGDAVADPAIFIPPGQSEGTIILGADTNAGLYVYDLSGEVLQFLPVGPLTNVDTRFGLKLGDKAFGLAVATNRGTGKLNVFTIDPQTSEVSETGIMPHDLGYEDPETLCLFADPTSSRFYAFAGDMTGRLSQWEIRPTPARRVAAIKVRDLKLPSPVAGCVVDDSSGTLYVAEKAGIVWAFDAAPMARQVPHLLYALPQEEPGKDEGQTSPIMADFGGIALVDDAGGEQYLLLSSRGNHRYGLISTRTGHLSGIFAVTPRMSEDGSDAPGIDGVGGTQGLDASSMPTGAAFPGGLLVVQDSFNTDPDGNQNFKYVRWHEVLEAVPLSAYPARK
jgi:3-phytase